MLTALISIAAATQSNVIHIFSVSWRNIYYSNMHSSAVENATRLINLARKCLQSALKGCAGA